MYHFEYVPKEKAKPYHDEFENIIHEVQDIVRPYFTFRYKFIGSYERNMITFDPTTYKGFDYDVNLYINDRDETFSANEIKTRLMDAIDKVAPRKGFDYCEDSTRVITLEKYTYLFSTIGYSCDFAVIRESIDHKGRHRQEYVRRNNTTQNYTWEFLSKPYAIDDKISWIKKKKLWNMVYDRYLEKKNNRTDLSKKSRALYAETINEVCQKYGYKKGNGE